MVKSKSRDSSNFTLRLVPVSYPSPPQYPYSHWNCSGRTLPPQCSICQVGTRLLDVVLGNSTIRRLGYRRWPFLFKYHNNYSGILNDPQPLHDHHGTIVHFSSLWYSRMTSEDGS